jgi:RND family efflux transporter MFP subunit
MSEANSSSRPAPAGPPVPRDDEGGLHAPSSLGPLGKVWWWFHFAVLVKLARLRFIAILVGVGAVIAYWDTLNAWYEKWTRPFFGQETAVASDTEYWCPMHPTIVRDHPDKCPICAMPLSKRKKGEKEEDEALPPGVVSRVQLTPYKVAVAGIETAEVGYRALAKEITAAGFVEFDERKLARITSRITGKTRIDKLYVNVTGQLVQKGEPLALLYSPHLVDTMQNLRDAKESGNQSLLRMARERLQLWGIQEDQIEHALQTTDTGILHAVIRSPISGHVIKKYLVEGEYVEEGTRLYDVADLSTVWIEAQIYEDELAFVRGGEGLPVSATTKAFSGRTFEGKVAFIYPHLDAATRTLKVRFDMDNAQHDLRPGMYATVRLQVPVTRLDLLPPDAKAKQKQAYHAGQVLAVPERAVIDAGSHKFVYRESEPDVFEALEVELGPRCGGFYPVIRGLSEGDRVVTTGSFNVDAETRLTGAAGMYFGSSGGPHGDHNSVAAPARPSMTRDEDAKVQAVLAKLDPADRKLAEAQGYCPVLGTRLGAMGVPVKLTLRDQPVFLCCKGCTRKAKSDDKAILDKVTQLKAHPNRPPAAPTGPSTEDAKVRANLAQLGPEDRRLAEEQVYCPIQEGVRLGKMGVPVSVEIKGRKVFLCCKGCTDDALANPDQTLEQVEKQKQAAPRPRSGRGEETRP